MFDYFGFSHKLMCGQKITKTLLCYLLEKIALFRITSYTWMVVFIFREIFGFPLNVNTISAVKLEEGTETE